MSELTDKILKSGLVDEATAQLMERWGYLPEGAAELTKHEELKNATREKLVEFAEAVGEEVDKHRRLKETMLDLNQLRWPVLIKSIRGQTELGRQAWLTGGITAVVDRMGRYYFRPQDIQPGWLVPGNTLEFDKNDTTSRRILFMTQTILEVTELFVGEDVAAIQVSATEAKEVSNGDV